MTVAERIYRGYSDNFTRGSAAFSQAMKSEFLVYRQVLVVRHVFVDFSVLVERGYFGNEKMLIGVER